MPTYHPPKTLQYLIVAIPFLVLAAWFYFKVFQFQYLNEFFGDGIATLQISRGWLEGRPLLYDAFNGFHFLQHNYYFIPIIGIITKFTGIYGLFITYLGLLALFLIKWFRWLQRYQTKSWFNEWVAVVLLVVGPVAYHIFLDHMGWHPEQYFMPLMGLFALSLATHQWRWAIFWGFLTFTVKETAILLIWGLLLFASVVTLILKSPQQKWYYYYFNRKNLIITVICLALFLLGMWWLSHLNGNAPSRLNRILDRIQERNSGNKLLYYTSFAGIISIFTIFFCSLPFLAWLRIIPNRWVIFGVFTGVSAVLCVVFFIEGLYNFPSIGLGLRYPPRIGSLWAFILGCYLFLTIRMLEAKQTPPPYQMEWVLWGGILQFLFHPMLVSNNDEYAGFMLDANKHVSFISQSKLGLNPYPKGTYHQLHELSQKLPLGAELVCESSYLNIFQKFYPCVWDLRRAPFLKRPLLYIYDKKKIGKTKDYFFPKSGYTIVPNNNLLILADSTWYSQRLLGDTISH